MKTSPRIQIGPIGGGISIPMKPLVIVIMRTSSTITSLLPELSLSPHFLEPERQIVLPNCETFIVYLAMMIMTLMMMMMRKKMNNDDDGDDDNNTGLV